MRAVPGMLGPRRVTATSTGWSVRTSGESLELSWGSVTRVSEAGRFVLVEQTPTVVHPVPATCVRDVTAFVAAINAWRAADGDDPVQLVTDPVDATGREHGPAVPWSARRAVAATAVILLLDQALAWASYGLADTAGDVYVAFGSLAAVCGGAWLAVRRWGSTGVRALLGRRPRWSDVGAGVVVGLGILAFDGIAMTAVAAWLPPEWAGDAQGWIDAAMLAAPLTTGIAVVLTGPVSEEVLFRGLLFRGLRRRGTVMAAVLSAALFAAVHPVDLSPASIVLMTSIFVTGLVLAAATVWRGTLVTAIVAHVVINGVATGFGMVAGHLPWVIPAGAGSAVTAFELSVGDCAVGYPDEPETAPPGGWVSGSAVACEIAHDVEVYELWPAAGADGVFPGHGALATEVDQRCLTGFDDYVGRGYMSSDLDYMAVVPDEAAWTAGRRDLRCVLFHVDGDELVGPARDSGW